MTLRITLEIIPLGREEEAYVIETVNVSNMGEKAKDFDVYEYIVEHNSYKTPNEDTPWIEHKRTDGAITLARKALEVLE